MHKKQLFAAAILLSAVCANAQAADIQQTGNKLCAFKLEGAISAGDYDNFSKVISQNAIELYSERTSAICLKSDGGSYAEALKLSELIYNRGISTVIEYGSECFSACAIIFMAGVSPEKIIPSRKLSIGGVLGFHAPYLTMPDGKYSKEQMEGVAQGMRMAIGALIRFSSKRTKMAGGDFIKQSLIAKILEKGPQEAFFVRTISEAARWDIVIYDAPKITNFGVNGVKNICNNFHYSNMDEPVPPNTNLSVKIEQYSSKYYKDDFRILVQAKNEKNEVYTTVCEIYAKESNMGLMTRVCSFDYWSNRHFGDCREFMIAPAFRIGNFVADYFALDPDTLLKKFSR